MISAPGAAVPKTATAAMIGSIGSYFSAVKFGPLHYRTLEGVKINGLKCSRGNFDSPIA